jgi:hypothetical protein
VKALAIRMSLAIRRMSKPRRSMTSGSAVELMPRLKVAGRGSRGMSGAEEEKETQE